MDKTLKTIILSSSLILSAVLLGESIQAAGVLRVNPANPRYFTDDTGKVIYLTGSHTWSNFFEEAGDLNNFDYPGYLNFLIARNHNFIRSWSWVAAYSRNGTFRPYSNAPLPWPRTGPGNAADSLPKFDLQRFDQAYFDRLRSRIIAARERNIYVSIMFFEGWCLAGEETGDSRQCWTWHPFRDVNNINGINGDTNGDGKGFEFFKGSAPTAVKNIQKAYIKKTVDTVNDLDNVLYEIVNEASPESTSWQYEMITYLKNYQSTKPKQHPIGMTSRLGDPDDDDLFASAADWISPGKNSSDQYTTSFPAADGRKVMIMDNDHLLSGPDRTWVWKGFLRGLNPIFMESTDLMTDTDSRKQGVRDAMGHTLSYAKRMNLSLSTPRESLASTAYCLANPGQEYLVYQPASGIFTVNLTAGGYDFEWFNPSSGAVAGTGSITATGGNRSFSPPFSGNAVLYLKKPGSSLCGDSSCNGTETCQTCPADCGICPNIIPKTNWTLRFVDSQETINENTPAVNAFDNNNSTLWHTLWHNSPQPHEIQINLNANYSLTGLRYLPRQDGGTNGIIKNYEFYTSTDGANWTRKSSGTFASDNAQKEIFFTQSSARYIRFRSLSEINNNPWASVAEITLLGEATGDNQAPNAPSGLLVR